MTPYRKGEYIEEVQARGLADRAGLRVGDRIIEVNGVNIETNKSRDVVNRIRSSSNIVTLLLVDPKTDGYFRKKAVTITTSLAEEFFDDKVGKVRKGKSKKDKSHIKPRYCRLVKAHKEDYGLYVVIDNNRIGQCFEKYGISRIRIRFPKNGMQILIRWGTQGIRYFLFFWNQIIRGILVNFKFEKNV